MELVAVRYSTQPWPRYRFRPGENPHPTAHPDGHSFVAPGQLHSVPRLVGPDQWRSSDAYLFGCDLYNHAYWWEAHETWEGLWQQSCKSEVQGQFLQGLIQVSACHLKLQMANLRGVRELLTKSAEHLAPVLAHAGSDPYMGLPLAQWHQKVRDYYTAILSGEPLKLRHDARHYPYIVLIL